MTVNRLMSALGLILAVNAYAAKEDCGDPPPVSKETLVTCLRDVFHVTRGPNDVTNKEVVRGFMVEHFRNISATVDKATVEEQRFPAPDQTSTEGVNIVYVLPGSQWGSQWDNVLVVAANYDTTNSITPGVEDNGSGMAALLETARVMSSRAERCTPDTTVIFVAVDELQGEIGFTSFGTEYLMQKVLRKYVIPPDHFRGVFILKGLMNFDPTEKSQEIPTAVYMLASEPANAIAARGYRGDFLAAISLSSDGVGEVATSYHQHWMNQPASSRRPLLYNFELPVAVGLVKAFREHAERFMHAGVFTFWSSLSNYTGHDFNIVVLTDTVQMRGYMRHCHRKLCDNLEMALKPDNVELLRVTTSTLVHYLVEASWITDDVTTAPQTDTSAAIQVEGTVAVLCAVLAAWLLA